MRRFTARSVAARLPVYAFAALLAFKAAVPMLASVAAAGQGKAVAEICDVYGVALPAAKHASMSMSMAAPADGGDPHRHHHHADHTNEAGAATAAPASDEAPAAPHHPSGHRGGDHCALTALAALATGDAGSAAAITAAAAHTLLLPATGTARPADDAARWAARLGHGPPSLS